jgi:hypothetical protein
LKVRKCVLICANVFGYRIQNNFMERNWNWKNDSIITGITRTNIFFNTIIFIEWSMDDGISNNYCCSALSSTMWFGYTCITSFSFALSNPELLLGSPAKSNELDKRQSRYCFQFFDTCKRCVCTRLATEQMW